MSGPARHDIAKVRRDIRRRHGVVSELEMLSPRMRRITFTSPDFADFESPSPDDHVKVFFPAIASDGAATVSARDYTPRAFDLERRTLTLDFVLHAAGPATSWARTARVGDTLEIAGPRGSTIVADDFDWYLLVGDTSALPAIGRRVETLRDGVPVTTVVMLDDDADVQAFTTGAAWQPQWLVRRPGPAAEDGAGDASAILAALDGLPLHQGDGFVWVAGETAVARAVRRYLIEQRQHPPAWLKASAYWTRGRAEREAVGDDLAG